MSWTHELHRLGGIATTQQLRHSGATTRQLTEAVHDGRLIRLRKGMYGSPETSAVALDAVRAGGRLCCVSAARSYGLWGGVDPRMHIMVRPHATRLPDTHSVRHWADHVHHDEVWRVSVEDCLRSVVRCADDETAVAVLDTALSAGLVTLAGLGVIFRTEPKRCAVVAAGARPGSDSGVESIVRQRLSRRGHMVEQQIGLPGVGRVDMRVDGRLYLEIDGFAYHSDRDAFERDRIRDIGMALHGVQRLRISARQVLDHPDTVIATIEAVLRKTEESA